MPKKVFELANELGIGAIDLVEKLKTYGLNVRNHMASLSDEELSKVTAFLKSDEDKKKPTTVVKKAVKKAATTTATTDAPKSKATSAKTVKTVRSGEGEETSTSAKAQRPEEVKAAATEAPKSTAKKKSIIRRKVHDSSLQEKDYDHEDFGAEHLGPASEAGSHDEDENQDYREEVSARSGDTENSEITHHAESSSYTEGEEVSADHTHAEPETETMLKNSSKHQAGFPDLCDLRRRVMATLLRRLENTVKINRMRGVLFGQKAKEDFPELRGLQVVYRPPKEMKEMKGPSEVKKEEEVAKATGAVSERPRERPVDKGPGGQKKVYLEEKMHSFTPIYTPPKPPEKPAGEAGADKAGEKMKLRQVPTPAAGENKHSMVTGIKKPEDLDEEGRKRMGGLAAMMAKPKSKVRDMEQLRADEELKIYNMGLVGKSLYTPPGRKKNFTGLTKGTMITSVKESKRVVEVHWGCRASELAQKLSIKFEELRDKCLQKNLLIHTNDYLGLYLLSEVCSVFNYRVRNLAFDEQKVLEANKESLETQGKKGKVSKEIKESKPPKVGEFRAPVVTIMGHVDHGKTTLLDYIRRTKLAAGEAGGITQHLGAYTVKMDDHKEITFIDTPGHAAFSSMRERGANVTDIVVLVVAVDDGVMPQTRESIKICQAIGVPIIVAVNKMDKEGVNPDRIKQVLMDYQLTPEDWGGETQYVPLSALTGMGVDQLLESILVQAEIMDLKATTKGSAEAVTLESRVEPGRGPMVTVLVKSGTLKVGDAIVVGENYGRVRSLLDPVGNAIKSAGPSTPAQILGLDGTPHPGEKLNVIKNEREAKKIVDNRIEQRKELEGGQQKNKVSLEDFFNTKKSEDDGKKVLKLIVRSDVLGSYEALKSSLEIMGNDEVGVEVIAGGTGAITETDVQLAISANGYILGFNMRPITSAQRLAEDKGVDIKTYRIIYELLDEVKLALEGMLEPDRVEKYIGRAEVRDTFTIPKIGTIAGSAVIDGKIEKGCHIRLLRDGKIVYDGKLSSLKRFKDDVKEVKIGYECGISLDNYNTIQVNDIFEAYIYEQKKRTLDAPKEGKERESRQ